MSKKTLCVVAALIGAVVWSANAVPITFRDFDSITQTINNGNPSYSSTFNIAAGDGGAGDVAGYSLATHTISSATASFVFQDTDTQTESVTINLGGNPFINQTFTATITLGGGITGTILGDLQADGILSYTVQQNSGSNPFMLVSAELLAEATSNSANSVPEGGSNAAMLGAAALALGIFGRKLKTA